MDFMASLLSDEQRSLQTAVEEACRGELGEAIVRQDPGPDGSLGTADDGGMVTLYDFDPAYRGAAFVQNEPINRDGNHDDTYELE
jgi:hypothetical protein